MAGSFLGVGVGRSTQKQKIVARAPGGLKKKKPYHVYTIHPGINTLVEGLVSQVKSAYA